MWYPELAGRVRITLVEALPSVLPMFSKQLIEYTESTFKESKINILTKTIVKEVKEKGVVLQLPDKTVVEVPCGLVIWAAGNKGRKITQDLIAKLPEFQKNRRGIEVDGASYPSIFYFSELQVNVYCYCSPDFLRMKGTNGSIFAIGDCTATSYAPTAQVASQQGAYLARTLHLMARKDALVDKLAKLEHNIQGETSPGDPEEKKKLVGEKEEALRQLGKIKLRPFHYSHQGTLAYIGSDKAIADLPFMNGNVSWLFSFSLCSFVVDLSFFG